MHSLGSGLDWQGRAIAGVVDELRADPVRATRAGAGDHAVPALLFVPAGDGPLPLVLLGHGAPLEG